MCERIAVSLSRRLQPAAERFLRVSRVRRIVHRRALRAWRSTDTPLILCYGNINRSPFAAALAAREHAKSPVSAGFYPVSGRRSPELTIERAAAYGVDLSAHRSATVDAAQLDAAPAIFVFDLMNVAAIACRRPRALTRTHLLGAVAESGAVVVPDPHGQPPEVLEATLRGIVHAVRAGAPVVP